MRTLYSLLFILLSTGLSAQATITGTVTDADSGKPIAGATVFLAETTKGTYTAEDGTFELNEVAAGPQQLVVSYLGYTPYQRALQIRTKSTNRYAIILSGTSHLLATVEVAALKPRKRARFLRQFTTAFLGETALAGQCQIENPETLRFTTIDGGFTTQASDLIVVHNPALGYKLRFLLDTFAQVGTAITYSCKPLFEDQLPTDPDAAQRVLDKRRRAYEGSQQHLLRALYLDRVEAEGFRLHLAQVDAEGSISQGRIIRRDKLVQTTSIEDQLILQLPALLQVDYLREEDNSTQNSQRVGNIQGLGQAAERDMIVQEANEFKAGRRRQQGQRSYWFARTNRVLFHHSGYFLQPDQIVTYGYWSREGAADMLPLDYDITAQASVAPVRKGFVLENLQIPLDDIQDGGPEPDAIPAIDDPQFDQGEGWSEQTPVLGIVIDGLARAYPIPILNYHEIVNDRFGAQAVVITYCPLCSSGMAFSAAVNGDTLRFGVSGLLYNSDVLLFDRQTQSLWSQIAMKCVAGQQAGQQLSYLVTEHTTLGAWRVLHPDTEVLAEPSGSKRDYTVNPYPGYADTEQLLFSVSNTSKALRNKDLIYGIVLNNEYKAYPLRQLKATQTDTVGEETLTITYDAATQTVTIQKEDGSAVTGTRMYWFAWYAFYPDTEVF